MCVISQSKQNRDFLVVQWLGLRAFTAKDPGFDPWSGNYDSVKPCGMTPKKKQQ